MSEIPRGDDTAPPIEPAPAGAAAPPIPDDGGPLLPSVTVPAERPHWGFWSAIAVLAAAHLGQVALWGLIGGFASLVLITLDPVLASHPEQLQDAVLVVSILPVALSSALLTALLVYASVSVRCGRPLLPSVGLVWPGPGRAGRFAAAGMAVAVAGAVLIAAFPPGRDQDVGGPLSRLVESGWAGFAMWAFLGVVVAPVTEELLFRGYAYPGLRRRLGPAAAGVLITLLFVLPHMVETGTYWPALAGIATLAILLARTMEATGNLVCCIAMHAGYNASLAALSALATG